MPPLWYPGLHVSYTCMRLCTCRYKATTEWGVAHPRGRPTGRSLPRELLWACMSEQVLASASKHTVHMCALTYRQVGATGRWNLDPGCLCWHRSIIWTIAMLGKISLWKHPTIKYLLPRLAPTWLHFSLMHISMAPDDNPQKAILGPFAWHDFNTVFVLLRLSLETET